MSSQVQAPKAEEENIDFLFLCLKSCQAWRMFALCVFVLYQVSASKKRLLEC